VNPASDLDVIVETGLSGRAPCAVESGRGWRPGISCRVMAGITAGGLAVIFVVFWVIWSVKRRAARQSRRWSAANVTRVRVLLFAIPDKSPSDKSTARFD
jgi:hypothetical protein